MHENIIKAFANASKMLGELQHDSGGAVYRFVVAAAHIPIGAFVLAVDVEQKIVTPSGYGVPMEKVLGVNNTGKPIYAGEYFWLLVQAAPVSPGSLKEVTPDTPDLAAFVKRLQAILDSGQYDHDPLERHRIKEMQEECVEWLCEKARID